MPKAVDIRCADNRDLNLLGLIFEAHEIVCYNSIYLIRL